MDASPEVEVSGIFRGHKVHAKWMKNAAAKVVVESFVEEHGGKCATGIKTAGITMIILDEIPGASDKDYKKHVRGMEGVT
jgi:hypothetical protein